jgi:hypothetical protein
MDKTSRLEQRIANRRKRRWKRRARIAAPFLTIPALVATLMLSVGIVEYQPKEAPPKLTDRPISKDNLERRTALHARRPGLADTAVLTSPSHRKDRLLDTLRPLPTGGVDTPLVGSSTRAPR